MLTLNTFPAAKGRRNIKTRLDPFSLSFWRTDTQHFLNYTSPKGNKTTDCNHHNLFKI